MGNFKDLTGQRFGMLVVVSYSNSDKHKKTCWNVMCDCGNTTIMRGSNLRSGNTKSCECNRFRIEDLVGKRFSRLVVVSYSHADRHGNHHWNTVCDCGNTQAVFSGCLKNGNTKSCGCLKKELASARCSLVGPLHPSWKSDKTDEERIQRRRVLGYLNWCKCVYERDDYTCQKCGKRGGSKLNAHHIEGYAYNPELRIELSNGVTLCEDCHKDYHHMYGNHATREKFNEWIYKGILCRIEIVMEKVQREKDQRLAEA